jgi:putative Ca2+/H+ antiporter (TMEM165/GDT1 family)
VKTSSLPVVPLVLRVPQTTLDPTTNNTKGLSESATATESTDSLLVAPQEQPGVHPKIAQIVLRRDKGDKGDKEDKGDKGGSTEKEKYICKNGMLRQLESAKVSKVEIWRIFCSTFFTIFLAEMGDKTQLATLLMSAQSDSPWVVFAGAALALIATSLLGVVIGCWIAKRLSPKTIETSAGALLLFISVMLLWDVVKF